MPTGADEAGGIVSALGTLPPPEDNKLADVLFKP
jgi:hypothetical protein